jgi:hypothetical protein
MTTKIDTPIAERRWHVDRNIPLALIYLLLGQFIVGVWVVSRLFSNVESQDKRIAVIEQQKVSERLMTLESQMQDTKQVLYQVNSNVLRILERQGEDRR